MPPNFGVANVRLSPFRSKLFGKNRAFSSIRLPSHKTKQEWILTHSCLFLVGKTRLELATTRPPDAYANQLRYFPFFLNRVQR